QDTLRTYGKACPDDWIEHNPYRRSRNTGVVLRLLIDLARFGVLGLTVWPVQMVGLPGSAAGVVSGPGQAVSYRTCECKDAATTTLPWGVPSGAVELPNSHPTYPTGATLSAKKSESDRGWKWIRLFRPLGPARLRRVAP